MIVCNNNNTNSNSNSNSNLSLTPQRHAPGCGSAGPETVRPQTMASANREPLALTLTEIPYGPGYCTP